MKTIDFYVRNEQSIILLLPATDQAHEWVKTHLSIEDWQNKNRIAIEPRYFDDIYEQLLYDGFKLKAA
jgi:hypothetical protein